MGLSQRLKENLRRVQLRIDQAAERGGRNPQDVRLIAVTKYVEADVVRALVGVGCRELGESRPQVLWEKSTRVQDLDIHWHLIGHLQRNKIRRTMTVARLIHSVDRIRLAQAIHAAAEENGRAVRCLLQINISGEANKHGFAPDELEAVLPQVAACPRLHVVGLMGMASRSPDPERVRHEFRTLRGLRDRWAGFDAENIDLCELSMGMSGDFEIAIEEGATLVRIGSLLFDGIAQ